MQSYIPPIDDYRFLLEEVLDFDGAMTELGKERMGAAKPWKPMKNAKG